MPARAEKIYIYPANKNQPGQVIRFPIWWDRRGFFEKYHDREIDLDHPLYVDYALLLTPGEALEWDKISRMQLASSSGSVHPKVLSDMQQVESALKNAKWVIVESSEWESGLE
jgi:hypothetical protein